ncbi:hypothetical protein RHGRI_016556 [Rhododendron griersonianum]|uniref:HAT C-terminal dimerisation domain-containing protein n=1 Tax=Rhododendron griersonianum TaxID=479676 RepID=A0AAV6JUL7_9ERIC|nr:hypothetical protein RHGRI_016556 [Rhododendron griersonianum]
MASVNMSTAVNEGAPQSQQQVPSTPSESQQPCPATMKVIDTLNRICGEYAKFESSKPSSHQVVHEAGLEQPNIGAGGSQQAFSLKSKFQKHLAQEGNGVGKSEVDRYLGETCENDVPNFDLLNWWKVNSPRYAVLSQVAQDLLAIPVSSVASESAFSTGGRVLD